MTPDECKRYVQFIDSQELELTPPKKRGEAVRVNCESSPPGSYRVPAEDILSTYDMPDRLSITSTEMADRLHSLLAPHLPPLPYPASLRRDGAEARAVHSCNSNIRMYKYTPGQHFGCHYDDAVRDPQTGARSEWTLLVYLTGVEDGVKGGEVGMLLCFEKRRTRFHAPGCCRLYSTLDRRVNGGPR